MREYAIEMGGKEDRIKIIRHGVIMSEFLGANGEHIRDQLHFEKSDVVLFFMGWLYSFSGIDDVAEQIIAREDSRMKLLVVGKGDLLDKMRKISSMSNGRVVCLNWVDHKRIPEYIAASDICLLPSMKVGIMNRIVPIKMIEYLAAGKPVIATRLEGLVKEFGEDSGVAFIDSTAQVVAKVEELLSNGSITGMSKDATRYASNCDWDDIFLEFEHYLSNLADSFRSR
jgi:glycosyltransferase involved in cell wall biosynthesis